MLSRLLVTLALVVIAFTPRAFADDCRVLEDGMRIETKEQVASLQDVCEIKGGIGIFSDEIEEATFPKLQKAERINIEAFGLKAVAFPALKSVRDLRISGGQLEVAEFPNLRDVHGTLYIKSRRLKYLHFPNLGTVYNMNIQGNFALEFMFLDSLYDIARLNLANNPVLDPAISNLIYGSTRVLTKEEEEFIAQAKADAHAMKLKLIEKAMSTPPPPPTGHHSEFGTYTRYYAWYPHHYHRYWSAMDLWGYGRWYRAPYYRW